MKQFKTYVVQGLEHRCFVKVKYYALSKDEAIALYRKALDKGHIDRLDYTVTVEITAEEEPTAPN